MAGPRKLPKRIPTQRRINTDDLGPPKPGTQRVMIPYSGTTSGLDFHAPITMPLPPWERPVADETDEAS